MGVGLIIAAVTIGATVATTLFAKGPRSTKGADMAPANLDAFRLTTAEEGTVIPRVFGTVRLPGNLLYYGNLSSEPEYEETTVGGKGGKATTTVWTCGRASAWGRWNLSAYIRTTGCSRSRAGPSRAPNRSGTTARARFIPRRPGRTPAASRECPISGSGSFIWASTYP